MPRKKKDEPAPLDITIKRRITGQVPEEYHFHLSDGRQLTSLHDLIKAMDDMSEDTFTSHVNAEKNDFSSWVQGVLKDDLLAEELKKTTTKVESQLKLLKHVMKEVVQ